MALPIILLLAAGLIFIILHLTGEDKRGKTPPGNSKYPNQYYNPNSSKTASTQAPGKAAPASPVTASTNNPVPVSKPAPVPPVKSVSPKPSSPPVNTTVTGNTTPTSNPVNSRPAWYISGHQLKTVQQAGDKLPIFSIFTYYPKRYTGAPQEVEEVRRLIYAFKDGKNTRHVANIVSSVIYNILLSIKRLDDAHKFSFAIVPASTNAKNEIRYRQFCQIVCERLNFTNLFDAIKIDSDRDALKGAVGISKTDNLTYNQQLIAGKIILLFDDVKTTGASIHQNCTKLMELGAHKVLPIVLAETYSERNSGFPYWYITRHSTQSEDKGDDLPF